MKHPNGFILYEGPSKLDGQPIVVIATGYAKPSANDKTSDMIQTWIMRSDIEPHTAIKTGADVSVCGDCRHRGSSCYVRTHEAPLSVYRAYKRGRYLHAWQCAEWNARRDVSAHRGGSYGDPAAVPKRVWVRFFRDATIRTAYTHQWRKRAGSSLKALAMASVDNASEYGEAIAKGFRTFRVRRADEPILPGEIICPASKEGGHKTTCNKCGLCMGNAQEANQAPRKHDLPNIVIYAHGATAGRF